MTYRQACKATAQAQLGDHARIGKRGSCVCQVHAELVCQHFIKDSCGWNARLLQSVGEVLGKRTEQPAGKPCTRYFVRSCAHLGRVEAEFAARLEPTQKALQGSVVVL